MLHRLFDMLMFTLERLWQHWTLAFWALVGLSAATTLALSLALYVDAVNTGLLASRLSDPPYAFRFRYLGDWNGNITTADVATASAAIQDGFTDTIGLPVAQSVHYLRGQSYTIRAGDYVLDNFPLSMVEGAEQQMEIIAGEWPVAEEDRVEGEIPVLLAESWLDDMGVSVGDELTATLPGGGTLTLWVAAMWRPYNADDPAWIFTPRFFDAVLLVQPEDFATTLGTVERPITEAAWSVIFDGTNVRTSDVNGLLARIGDGQRDIEAALPGIRLDLSPVDGLRAFNTEVAKLTQQLAIIIMPVAGLVLYFVALVAGLLVNRQTPEDVTLSSRGMSRRAILGIHALMWLLLAGAALGIGMIASPFVVQLVGQTVSFLHFDSSLPKLDVTQTVQALQFGALTALVAASSGLFSAWRSTRQTITGYRQSAARASKAWWQRMYLDVLLFIPAAYVLYSLSQKGKLAAAAETPFSDPLVFLGPALFSLSLTLLFLRVWPMLLGVASRFVAYSADIPLLMALRELGRSIGRYRGTLLMMCFTLSLTGFTASMASTLDRSLSDKVDYDIGADAVLVVAADAQTESSTEDGQTTTTITGYNILPASDLLDIDGIEAVSPVGRYTARIVLPSQRIDGTVLGVDRSSLASIARFRPDYAETDPAQLAELLNRLAGNRTGILVNARTAADYNLRVGQEVTLQINALNEWYETTVPIVGLLDYFPTLDPGAGFFAVTNLQPIFELVGTDLPHDIWLGLSPDADRDTILREARAHGFPVLSWLETDAALREAQAEPARRGVLGFLSVGFVASILLTLVGAIVQSAASFRAQATQLGALRAMGMAGTGVRAYTLLLQGIASASGILGGTFIGVSTALLFLPLLDFSGGLPPYLVRVAWDDIIIVYTAFGLVLLAVSLLSALLIGRQRLAAVLKMGDV